MCHLSKISSSSVCCDCRECDCHLVTETLKCVAYISYEDLPNAWCYRWVIMDEIYTLADQLSDAYNDADWAFHAPLGWCKQSMLVCIHRRQDTRTMRCLLCVNSNRRKTALQRRHTKRSLRSPFSDVSISHAIEWPTYFLKLSSSQSNMHRVLRVWLIQALWTLGRIWGKPDK